MTLVDTSTGEILSPLTRDEAIILTARIVQKLEEIWPLVIEAYRRRAWEALDYPNWDAYCKEEFGTDRIKLPASKRLEVVASMRAAGMSTRAIASATGMGKSQIANDVAHLSTSGQVDPDDDVADAEIVGIDGKRYSPTRPTAAPPKNDISKEFDDYLLGRLKPEEVATLIGPDSRRPYNKQTANEWADTMVSSVTDRVESLIDMLPLVVMRAVAHKGDVRRWAKQLRQASEALDQYIQTLDS